MNHRRLAAISLFVALGSTIAAVYLYFETVSLQRQLADAAHASKQIAPGPRTGEPESPMESENAGSVALTDDAPPAAGDTQPAEGERQVRRGPRGGQDRRDRGTEAIARALADPEAREAFVARLKSQIDRQYGDLFVKLGLDEVQVETLRTLFAERQLARLESGVLERVAGTDEERQELQSLRDGRVETIESGIAAVLGTDGMEKLEAFQRTQPQRQAAGEIARRASYAGAPMSIEATDQLVTAMAEVQREYPYQNPLIQQWERGAVREPLTQDRADQTIAAKAAQDRALLAASQTFLSQPQLEALADRQLEEMDQLKAQLGFQLRNPDLAPGPGDFGGFGGGFGGRGPGGGRAQNGGSRQP